MMLLSLVCSVISLRHLVASPSEVSLPPRIIISKGEREREREAHADHLSRETTREGQSRSLSVPHHALKDELSTCAREKRRDEEERSKVHTSGDEVHERQHHRSLIRSLMMTTDLFLWMHHLTLNLWDERYTAKRQACKHRSCTSKDQWYNRTIFYPLSPWAVSFRNLTQSWVLFCPRSPMTRASAVRHT